MCQPLADIVAPAGGDRYSRAAPVSEFVPRTRRHRQNAARCDRRRPFTSSYRRRCLAAWW